MVINTIRMKKYNENEFLLSSLKSGDIFAYEYIYTQYQSKLYSYCRRMILDDSTAQDIVQEVFLKLWINRSKISIDPVAYLFRAVYNSAINTINHKKVIQKYETHLLYDFYFNTVSQLPDTETELLNRDVDAVIAKAKDALPPRCREIFDLSREEGLRNSEISEKLGLSVKSVENQMTIAIAKLKKSMKNFIDDTYIFFIFFRG